MSFLDSKPLLGDLIQKTPSEIEIKQLKKHILQMPEIIIPLRFKPSSLRLPNLIVWFVVAPVGLRLLETMTSF